MTTTDNSLTRPWTVTKTDCHVPNTGVGWREQLH